MRIGVAFYGKIKEVGGQGINTQFFVESLDSPSEKFELDTLFLKIAVTEGEETRNNITIEDINNFDKV